MSHEKLNMFKKIFCEQKKKFKKIFTKKTLIHERLVGLQPCGAAQGIKKRFV